MLFPTHFLKESVKHVSVILISMQLVYCEYIKEMKTNLYLYASASHSDIRGYGMRFAKRNITIHEFM